MSQNNYEERTRREKPAPKQDDELDLYLFWPSLSKRGLSSGDSPSSPLYGPVSFDSESDDYDSSVLGSTPPSPIMFAPLFDYRSPLPVEEALDFGTLPAPPPEEPDAGAQMQPGNGPAKYSPIFKMGLFLSQMAHVLDHAIEGVKIKLRKPKASELGNRA